MIVDEISQHLPSTEAKSIRLRMPIVFGLEAVVFAMLMMRVPDMQVRIGLSDAELGFVLMGGPIGAFLVFPFAPKLIERFGTRIMIISCFLLLGPTAGFLSLAFSGLSLFAAMVAFGALNSAADITINVEADRVEAATSGRLMNRCHGVWSVVFFVSSSIAGVVRGAGIDPVHHLWTLAPVFALVTLVLVTPMKECAPRPHTSSRRTRFVLPTLAIVVLTAFGIGGDLLEGSNRVWATIYLRDSFDVSPFIEGLALPAFVLTMAVGRLLVDGLINRFGPARVGRAAVTIALVGVLGVFTAPSAYVAILGFALAGIGVAPIYPLMISAAARLGDRPAAENVAATALVFQIIMLTAPMMIGAIAEAFSVRTAYGALLPLLVLGWIMAARLR